MIGSTTQREQFSEIAQRPQIPARGRAGRLLRVMVQMLLIALALALIERGAEGATGPGRTVSGSDHSFPEQVLRANVPVLVDFWAPWCVPCRKLEGALDEVAKELGGQVRIVRINITWNHTYADRYGVQALPTLLLFQNGKQVDRQTGALSAEDIKDLFATLRAAGPAAAPAAGPVAASAGAPAAAPAAEMVAAPAGGR
ncbi:MAG TPA: thioredoxin [Thermoanaerobaculia bacterium]|nr:thioredoxin [Thermoanaerobaculia bacterium]